ncbi:cation-translocating P-type ATPase [Terrimonas sp. NA20]|uniref:Cation-translocating P-type ATPase n=1 Tax=Terrimonas ginsenosidimutans TaxID=2908004 RepID=A0ABS9KSP7_9BACT|nr:cation-translocating P-type ATPase [Terrimonas ginsenosidimutans]MCG2615349.1 cation-translocating P-type ATPase [Terrimonas ginsenosidimutans]
MDKSTSWHSLSIDKVLQETGSNSNGLSDDAVQKKQAEFGKNELKAKKKKTAITIFLRQFLDVMVLVLIVAAVISAFLGELSDTIVIVIILILNAIIGFVQEYRAEKAMEALQKMSAPSTNVLRNGQTSKVESVELVPGDIVSLTAGDTVPADLRIMESDALKINEASLTGESNTVDKNPDTLEEQDPPLGDRFNMAFKGTAITSGKAKGVVIATGMQTELGKIAGMLDDAESSTPLQKRLSAFSRRLTVIIIILCAILFAVGFIRNEPWEQLLLTTLSLAVAAIPEALPAVVSVSLALGARRLMKQQVLIRKLYAVEALGSVTYICTDKTGTLTKNEMEVKSIWTADKEGEDMLLSAMRSSHDSEEKDGKWTGDPTEVAMLAYAKDQEELKRLKEIPFDSERKAMTTIHEKEGKYWMITKGATESIQGMLADKNFSDEIKKQEEQMAKEGMRVIGFAGKMLDQLPDKPVAEELEKELAFIGLAGMIDPPRKEAKDAIGECKRAGIVPVMITGDHPLTAAAIGKELGIVEKEEQVITGKELEALSDQQLDEKVEALRVYARVSPEQKLKIVKALQNHHQFVSMTGDGVNDAPSLKQANIGVAMGITGTDVTKESSSMILLDDNFATIVKAVREGRRIYDNIRKFIKYILTGNAAEIWTIVLAPIVGLPIPLLPVHILWVNLVTDGLPALALATEAEEKSIMERPPRSPKESIFAQGLGIHILWVGLFIGLLTVGTQWYSINHTETHWQTIVFTVLCLAQLWHVMAIRSEKRSLFSIGLFTNTPLLLAVGGTVLLQLAVIYVPILNGFFHTQPLTAGELGLAFGASAIVFVVVEIEKLIKRSMDKKKK